jgi:hypothetical protein
MAGLIDFIKEIDNDYDEREASLKRQREQSIMAAENTMLFIMEANSLGFKVPEPNSRWKLLDLTIHIKDETENPQWAEEWRVIKQLVGELTEYGREPYGDDARKRLAKITLIPKDEKFKQIKFTYIKRLPKGAKCKLKRVKQSSYLTLVCEG